MSYTPTVWQDGDHVTAVKLNKLEQGVDSMSYTPTVWSAGDVVTAEKLNKLEQGVADSGGGGGDLTTATVTFINNSGISFPINGCFAIETGGDEPYVSSSFEYLVKDVEESTATIIIFKGEADLYAVGDYSISTSGDIEDVGDGYYVVTGDCTITFSPKS